jgi:hypothetical protein
MVTCPLCRIFLIQNGDRCETCKQTNLVLAMLRKAGYSAPRREMVRRLGEAGKSGESGGRKPHRVEPGRLEIKPAQGGAAGAAT